MDVSQLDEDDILLIMVAAGLVCVLFFWASERNRKTEENIHKVADAMNRMLNSGEVKKGNLSSLIRKLEKEYNIPTVMVLKFFGSILFELYDNYIICKNKKIEFDQEDLLKETMSLMTEGLLWGFNDPEKEISNLNPEENLLLVAKITTLSRRNGDTKPDVQRRSTLILTHQSIIRVARQIELSELLPLAGILQLEGTAKMIHTGLKFSLQLNSKARDRNKMFSQKNKDEIIARFHKEDSSFTHFSDIKDVYLEVKKRLVRLWITDKNGMQYAFFIDDKNVDPFDNVSYFLDHLKIMAALNQSVLVPNKIENPSKWTIRSMDFSQIPMIPND